MKEQQDPPSIPQKQKQFGDLTPEQQQQVLREEIHKRIKDHQTKKIRNMPISELNEIWDKSVEPPIDGSRQNRIRLFNMKLGVTQENMDHSGLKSPGERHLENIELSEHTNKLMRAERKLYPIMSQVKRGKLGFDTFLLAFAIFGGFMLPIYFITHFQKKKEMIIQSRIAPPEVIKRLDEDSPIDIDDVSVQTIHYYNPDRIKSDQERKKRRDELKKLERDVYF